jgi:hypothetical protein
MSKSVDSSASEQSLGALWLFSDIDPDHSTSSQILRGSGISPSDMSANRADSTDPSAAKTDLQGIELAEHHFGPLLHPTHATQRAWTNYSINRLQTNQKYRTVPVPDSEEDSEEDEYGYGVEPDDVWLSNSIKTYVAQIEEEMGLEAGTLQKCITILYENTELDEEDVRTAR